MKFKLPDQLVEQPDMKATSRDVMVMALLIALAGTIAMFSAVLVHLDPANGNAAFYLLTGLGLMAWLYAAIAALEVADRRTLWQIATAAVLSLPIVTIVTALV